MGKSKKDNRNPLTLCGCFTIAPYYLHLVLDEWEERLLETLRFLRERGLGTREWISNSLIICESRFTKASQITKAKKALVELGFIKVRRVDRKLGTSYQIDYETISSIIERLNAERNCIRRMEMADGFREERGLPPLNKGKIKKFSGTQFDRGRDEGQPTETGSRKGEEAEEKEPACEFLRELEELQKDFSLRYISEWELKKGQERILEEARALGITIIKKGETYQICR